MTAKHNLSRKKTASNLFMMFIKGLPFPIGWMASIACFFQSKFTVSSLVVILNSKDEALLFHHTYRKKPWGLPGGYVTAKEHPKVSIKREVLEEAGLKIIKLRQLSIKLDKDLSRMIICYATQYVHGKFKPSNEVSESKYFSMDDLPELPNRQKEIIKEALTLFNGN